MNFQFGESSTFLAIPDSTYDGTLIDILERQIKVGCRIHENFVDTTTSHNVNVELLDNVERLEYTIATEGIFGITMPTDHESFIGEPSSKNMDVRNQTTQIEFDALASTGMLDEIVEREIMLSDLNSKQFRELEHERSTYDEIEGSSHAKQLEN